MWKFYLSFLEALLIYILTNKYVRGFRFTSLSKFAFPTAFLSERLGISFQCSKASKDK